MRLTSSAILLLGLCFITTGAIAQTQTSTSKQKLKDDPQLYITAAYSNDEQMATGYRCVVQDPSLFSYVGGSKSVLSLGDLRDFNQLQQDLNVDVSAKGGYGMFSGSTNASYARQVEDDNYSEGFYYDEIVSLPTEIYTPNGFGSQMLNSFGQQAEQADTTGQTFRTYCGDQYVMQTPLGARLIVTFKLDFASSKDHETFDANIKGGMGSIFSASASVSNMVNQYNLHGSLSVYALQEGGDASQLAKIFGGPTCVGHYCVSTCDLNNLNACQGIIDGIISYAANDFPAQIDFKDGQVTGSAVPLSYTMGTYAGVKDGQTVVTDAIKQARIQLGNIYEQQLQEYTTLSHLLTSDVMTAYQAPGYREEMQSMADTLNANLSLLVAPDTGVSACYSDPSDCVKSDGTGIATDLLNSLSPIDQQAYNQFSLSYHVFDESVLYDLIPVDDNDKYAAFHSGTEILTAYQTVTPTATGIHVDGTDIGNHHFWGDLAKQSDGSYVGTVQYDDGRVHNQRYTLVQNPY
ncbi:MAG: hypothetical protein K5Q00_07040 [Gammaproteobacteria bacterium]|nr:hypothetical protein [Gammaproteobacteria bacterium]